VKSQLAVDSADGRATYVNRLSDTDLPNAAESGLQALLSSTVRLWRLHHFGCCTFSSLQDRPRTGAAGNIVDSGPD
jgi:hypothetical protein